MTLRTRPTTAEEPVDDRGRRMAGRAAIRRADAAVWVRRGQRTSCAHDGIESAIDWADRTHRIDRRGAIGVLDFSVSSQERRVAATVPI
jgi:hypothetical protein